MADVVRPLAMADSSKADSRVRSKRVQPRIRSGRRWLWLGVLNHTDNAHRLDDLAVWVTAGDRTHGG